MKYVKYCLHCKAQYECDCGKGCNCHTCDEWVAGVNKETIEQGRQTLAKFRAEQREAVSETAAFWQRLRHITQTLLTGTRK